MCIQIVQIICGLTGVPKRGYQANPKPSTGRVGVTAQAEFDRTYVSSTELCQRLGWSRENIRQRREAGALPEPVRVYRPDGGVLVQLWRREQLEAGLRSQLAQAGCQFSSGTK